MFIIKHMEFGLSYEFENFPPPQQLLYAINYEILACTDGCQLFQGSKGGGLMGDYSLTQQRVFSGGGCSEFFIGDWLIGGGGDHCFMTGTAPLQTCQGHHSIHHSVLKAYCINQTG
jgi:hypothetical protein